MAETTVSADLTDLSERASFSSDPVALKPAGRTADMGQNKAPAARAIRVDVVVSSPVILARHSASRFLTPTIVPDSPLSLSYSLQFVSLGYPEFKLALPFASSISMY
jgi:hypothetical protein